LYITYTKTYKTQTLQISQVFIGHSACTIPKRHNGGYITLQYTMKQAKTKPFLMRLKPSTKHLLDKAKEDQRRSISSLIDESVRQQLGYRYGSIDAAPSDEKEVQA
jgi:hypothetical protein